jgi:hypothetical protein
VFISWNNYWEADNVVPCTIVTGFLKTMGTATSEPPILAALFSNRHQFPANGAIKLPNHNLIHATPPALRRRGWTACASRPKHSIPVFNNIDDDRSVQCLFFHF